MGDGPRKTAQKLVTVDLREARLFLCYIFAYWGGASRKEFPEVQNRSDSQG